MDVSKTTQSTIVHLRKEFLSEIDIQFVLDKCHRYGWADSYAFSDDGSLVGYGCLWGKKRDAIFEFYLVDAYRLYTDQFFATFCQVSNAGLIECQTNDKFLYPLFQRFADNIQTEAILFEDGHATDLHSENTSLMLRPQDNPDDRQYVLLNKGKEVGEGGFMLNYNFPYADVYYGIKENHRGKGYGSYFVQELKKEIYQIGRVPAARCNASNAISKATLLKAGMVVCGLRQTGVLRNVMP